ncbi:unnamed protein product [Rotaria sp. Silwood1]|nr:unnamed protein product [Rotaria sp. Silwood1]
MSVSTFEIVPDDILCEICVYLSPVDILPSLFSLTKRLSRILSHEYLWHIHIVSFIRRQRPQVFIHELDDQDIGPTYHCFMVYTLPCNDITLSSYIFSTGLKKSCKMPINPVDLLPRANTISLRGYKKTNCVRNLGNCKSSLSSLVP